MNPFHFLMSSTVRESSFADEVQYMIPINLEERGEDPQTTETTHRHRLNILPAALWFWILLSSFGKSPREN